MELLFHRVLTSPFTLVKISFRKTLSLDDDSKEKSRSIITVTDVKKDLFYINLTFSVVENFDDGIALKLMGTDIISFDNHLCVVEEKS